jgi:DNA (cytosine-5)-methyltransferase 1
VRYLSVCSGIEAASVAWHPLGWQPWAFAEIDKFPSAVLAHHYPSVPNLGDMTQYQEWPDAGIDVLVGGTPCQSFSVAGLRAGLADPRGSLMLTYLALAGRYRPRWVVWENVPGVRSSGDGRDLGAFLGGLGELGYGWAYRSLDAQYFDLAQRRERVFVVGHLGDWRRAAAVLFERASLSGDSAPRREAREGVATFSPSSIGGYSDGGGTLRRNGGDLGGGSETLIAHSLRADGFDASEDGTGRGTPLVAFTAKDYGADAGDIAPTLRAGGFTDSHANGGVMPAVALAIRGRDGMPQIEGGGEVANTVLTPNGGRGGIGVGAIRQGMSVRRLTPRECERLQGFPDDYTLIPYRGKPASDGPRYKALGNSMAVPVVRWIGQRMQMVDAIAEVA